MTRHRDGFTMIELVVVVAIIAVLIALLLPAVQSAREAARRLQCSNNLFQLGIAIENYESTHLVYPPGSIDRSGPVIESPTAYQFGWIARILPYLEQKNVYNRLDFRAGVYEVANLTARGISMSALLCPSDGHRPIIPTSGSFGFGGSGMSFVTPQARTTAYAACHNDVEAPIDSTNTGVFPLNRPIRIDDVEDGLAYTIFVGEKLYPGDEQGWASGTRATLRNTGTPINKTALDPTDLAGFGYQLHLLEPKDPNESTVGLIAQPPPRPATLAGPIRVGGFGSQHTNGANFLFGDGSARFLKSSMNSTVYRRLGSRADGEPVGDDTF